MEISGVLERVRRFDAARRDASAGTAAIEAALRAMTEVRAWFAAGEAELAVRLSAQVSFPEKAIADCTRDSLYGAGKAKERAETLGKVPEFADALNDAVVTAGHVDAITKSTKNLTDEQRDELFDRVADLVDVAAAATVRQFGERLDHEVKLIQREDGMARLERQKRATGMRTWTDGEGMFCLSGRWDPVTGVALAAKLDATREALFAETTPDTCPIDPIDKQRHLHALALVALVSGDAPAQRSGRPEYVVVIDSSQPDGDGGPVVDWGIPVEIPKAILAQLVGEADDTQVVPIVVRNGVVLHAPGQLDLARSSRLANQAQRRAMKAIYRTCAVPGCSVHVDRCKLHHIVEWDNGGLTNFANLLPVCPHHHAMIHANGWKISLGANRQLTITLPDGTILTTGPPTRSAARVGDPPRRATWSTGR